MFPDLRSKSHALHERAVRALPGGNSRHTVHISPYPIYAVRGEGARIIDVEGVSRLDFINNYSSLIHGHNHPEIVEAVREQAGRLLSVSMPTEAEIELAEIICERLPGVDQIRFANSGSEGVLMAIRGARAYTGRRVIAKVEGAYHGSSETAAVSSGPPESAWAPADEAWGYADPGIGPGTAADVMILQMNDVEGTRRRLRLHADELAGVIVDPLTPALGYQAASREFLQMLRDETRAAGALLIFDEVYTLRMGFNGAQGAVGVTPDLTAMGKIIGGGLPVGAVGGSETVMSSLFDPRFGPPKMTHGGTFNANPLTMAAGAAAMRLFDRAAFDRLSGLGERLRKGLKEAVKLTGAEAFVRGEASIAGLFQGTEPAGPTYRDLVLSRKTNRNRAPRTDLFFRHMLNNGVLMGAPGYFVLSTALTEADIDYVIEQSVGAFRAMMSEAA